MSPDPAESERLTRCRGRETARVCVCVCGSQIGLGVTVQIYFFCPFSTWTTHKGGRFLSFLTPSIRRRNKTRQTHAATCAHADDKLYMTADLLQPRNVHTVKNENKAEQR